MEVHVVRARRYIVSLTLFSKLPDNWVLHMRETRDTCEIKRQTGIHFLYQLRHWGIPWMSALLQNSCQAAFQLFTASLTNALIENASRKTILRETNLVSHPVIASKPSTSLLKDLHTCDPFLCCPENWGKTGTEGLDTRMSWLWRFKLSLTSGFGPRCTLQLSDNQSRHSLTHKNWETFLQCPGKWNIRAVNGDFPDLPQYGVNIPNAQTVRTVPAQRLSNCALGRGPPNRPHKLLKWPCTLLWSCKN